MYHIWSYEHNAWWGIASRGYVDTVSKAGKYSFQEAADIVIPHIPPGEEVAVLEAYAPRWQDEQSRRTIG